MNFDRMVRLLGEMKDFKEVKASQDHLCKSKCSQKTASVENSEHKDALFEFLSSRAQVFSEFDDMASFAASILRASSYPFFVVDRNMKIQYMNPACLNFTGLKLPDAIGRINCAKVFSSDLCEKKCAVKQAMATQKPVIGKRVKVLDKAGTEHLIIVTAGPLIDKKGKVLGGFETWRDAMPDEEVALRNKRFLDTVKSYCWGMESFLENKENWERSIDDMKQRTSALLDYCSHYMKSSCWDILNCPPERQVQCPAFPNHGAKCWEVDYTWCEGQMQGTVAEKKSHCKRCFVYVKEVGLK